MIYEQDINGCLASQKHSRRLSKEQFDKEGFKDIVFNLIPNNETLGECAAFYSMLDMVSSLKRDEYTFFAHAKGVTREVVRKKSWCSLQANKTWIKKMLAHNLMSTEKINRELGLPKSESLSLISSLFETIVEQLDKENIVKIAGFGTFKVRKKNKRIGRNPKTGIEAEISERRVVTYHASDKIKNKINIF